MQLVYDKMFIKEARKLPQAQKQKLASQLEIMEDNPLILVYIQNN